MRRKEGQTNKKQSFVKIIADKEYFCFHLDIAIHFTLNEILSNMFICAIDS